MHCKVCEITSKLSESTFFTKFLFGFHAQYLNLLQMNPNEEPFGFYGVQKIFAETEAPHIKILSYLVSVVAPLIPEMNFSQITE